MTAELDSDQRDWIDGARALIDWLEAHPERIEMVNYIRHDLFFYEREQLVDLAREFGKAEKAISGSFFIVKKAFGPHSIEGNIGREKVCRKVVTGTVEHEERIVPAHTEELVEWECDEPLLAYRSHADEIAAALDAR